MPLVLTAGGNHCGQLGRPGASNAFATVRLDVDAQQVCCGSYHTVVVASTGRLMGWGRNAEGQLGLPSGDTTSVDDPQLLLTDPTIAEFAVMKVACGEGHTMMLTTDGEVLVMGAGSCGQLGNGTCMASSHVPVKVTIPEAVADICSGSRTCFAVGSSGSVYAWGESASGMMGTQGVPADQAVLPVKLSIGPNKTRVHRVLASDAFAIYITSHYNVIGAGSNTHGQLFGFEGPSTHVWKPLKYPSRVREVACGFNHMVALLNSGRVVFSGANHLTGGPIQMFGAPAGDQCIGVAAGRYTTFAWSADGCLYAHGRNKDGQLGLGNNLDVGSWEQVRLADGHRVLSMSCGAKHTALLVAEDGVALDEGLMMLMPMEDEDTSDDDGLLSLRAASRWDEDISNISFSRAPLHVARHAGSNSQGPPSSRTTLGASNPSEAASHNNATLRSSNSVPTSPDEDGHDAFPSTKMIAITLAIAVAMLGVGWLFGRRSASRHASSSGATLPPSTR